MPTFVRSALHTLHDPWSFFIYFLNCLVSKCSLRGYVLCVPSGSNKATLRCYTSICDGIIYNNDAIVIMALYSRRDLHSLCSETKTCLPCLAWCHSHLCPLLCPELAPRWPPRPSPSVFTQPLTRGHAIPPCLAKHPIFTIQNGSLDLKGVLRT